MPSEEEVADRERRRGCIDCGGPLEGTVVGAGDGSGRKFVDHYCWLRREMTRLGLEPTPTRLIEYDLLLALREIERLQ